MTSSSKRKRYPIQIACVAWVDLLGYGAMLADANFQMNDARTQKAIRRLRVFQKIASKNAARTFQAMPINDGVAYFVDLGEKSNTVAVDFLRRSTDAFIEINRVDSAAGYPGARMVLAIGPRARVSRPTRSYAHYRSIVERLKLDMISQGQAVREAFLASPIAGFVPALQANFAFTRAYLANEAGSSKGLGGTKCYIDLALFSCPPPEWIRFARTQKWSELGLEVTFGELATVDWRLAKKMRFRGVRSTTDIVSTQTLTKVTDDVGA